MGIGTNQCISEVEPTDLDYITFISKAHGMRNRKGGSPRKCLHLRGVHMEEDMPTEEMEMQEK